MRRKRRVEFQRDVGAGVVGIVQYFQREIGDGVEVRRIGDIEPDLKISRRIVG
jgi:hypothetical protein